jgi:hypothetical protein
MLLETEANSLPSRAEPLGPPPKRGRLRTLPEQLEDFDVRNADRDQRACTLVHTGELDQCRPQRAQRESTIGTVNETVTREKKMARRARHLG